MDRLITTNTGGKLFTQDDLGFMQNCTSDAMKYMLTGLGLSSQTFILYGCNMTLASNSLTVSSGAMALSGEVVPVAEQTVAGTEMEKFWFVLQNQVGNPKPYFSGQIMPTQEYHSIKLVYSESQPAGGISVTSVVNWSKRFYDLVVSGNIPTKLSQLVERSYNDLTDTPNIPADLSTEWKRVEFISTKYVHYTGAEGYDGLRFRKNKIGHVELRGTFTVKLTPAETPQYAFYLPSGFIPSVNQTIPAFGTYRSTWYYSEIFTNGGFRLVPFTNTAPTGDYNLEIGSTIFM